MIQKLNIEKIRKLIVNVKIKTNFSIRAQMIFHTNSFNTNLIQTIQTITKTLLILIYIRKYIIKIK